MDKSVLLRRSKSTVRFKSCFFVSMRITKMKTILNAFGFLAMLGGFYFVYKAIDATFILSGSSGSGASAVQISQIYNTGAYFGIMALVCFVFVLCCLVAAGQQKSE